MEKESNMIALLYNLRMYTQIFALIGGTSRRRVSSYKSEYLYIHKYEGVQYVMKTAQYIPKFYIYTLHNYFY